MLANLAITHASFSVQSQWYMYQPSLLRRVYTSQELEVRKVGCYLNTKQTQIFVCVQVELTSVFFQTPPFIIIRGILAQVCFSLLAACNHMLFLNIRVTKFFHRKYFWWTSFSGAGPEDACKVRERACGPSAVRLRSDNIVCGGLRTWED